MSTTRMTRSLLGALLLPALAACGTGEARDASGAASALVVRGDVIVTAEATGVLEAVRTVEVTSKASGEILRLHVDVGDEIVPGALLAEIDPRDVRNTAEQARADVEVAQARMDIARRQVERSQELLETGVISPQEHESRTLEFANAQANLIKARTNSDLAELRLGDVIIRAPMAGTILERPVEVGTVIQSSGQNVSTGTTLMVMANLDEIQVRIFLNEGDLGEILEGMRTTVTVDAYPGRVFNGVVDQIEPQAVVQRGTTLFPLIVRLDNRSRLLKPGMNTEIQIQTGQATNVLLIPNNAVVMPRDAEPAALALGLDAAIVSDMEMPGMGAMVASGGRGGRGGRGGGARPGGQARPQGQGGFGEERLAQRRRVIDEARTQPAVVFLVGEGNVMEARGVMIGMTDWDRTQVLSGLDEGDRVAIIGPTQLQAEREEMLERMRARAGGNPFGGNIGGMGGRGGYRGGR